MKDWFVVALVGLVALGMVVGLFSGSVDGDRLDGQDWPASNDDGVGASVLQADGKPKFLFVASGTSGRYECGRLWLEGVPFVVFFSERPYRVTGHMGVEHLLDLWDSGEDSFRSDPPNAALCVFGSPMSSDIIVELEHPLLIDGELTFETAILQGSLPESFGPFSLFVDDIDYEDLGKKILDKVERTRESHNAQMDRISAIADENPSMSAYEAMLLQFELIQLDLHHEIIDKSADSMDSQDVKNVFGD